MEHNRYSNYIDGRWTEPSTGKYYQNINPADYDDVIGEYPLSSKADVDAAVESAQRAFQSWRKMLPGEREKILDRFISIVDQKKQAIGEMLTREQGKTLKEASGEPTRGVVECSGGSLIECLPLSHPQVRQNVSAVSIFSILPRAKNKVKQLRNCLTLLEL